MKQVGLFFKRIKIERFLMAIVAGFVLLLNTACNSGNEVGARPNNLPVQMGGNNNPHSRSGDGYTNYKMSTDPKVNDSRSSVDTKKRASGIVSTDYLADSSIRSNASDLIYPGSGLSETNQPDIGPVQQKSLPELPNQKQPSLKRSDPDAKILERVGEAFKDASAFLKDTAASASDRPEMQANPTVGQ